MKRAALSCLVLFLAFPASALPPEVEADRLAIKAKAALEAKDYAQASSSFDQLEKLNVPLPQSFHYLKGVALNGLRKFGAAKNSLDVYLRATGTSGKYYKEALMAYNLAESGAKLEPELVDIPGRDFAIGKYEVTQAQWRAVMGNSPASQSKGCDECPVETISWDDIQIYLKKLNQLSGQTYRLPSESEWKFACQSGREQSFCGSDELDAIAWHFGNAGGRTHPVGTKRANQYGIYDMNGNVSEWVADCGLKCWLRVHLGGHLDMDSSPPERDRGVSSVRDSYSANSTSSRIGFRVARSSNTK